MNINIGPLYEYVVKSRELVAQGIREADGDERFLADVPPILLPDPEYPGAYQVWFVLADGTGLLWVNPDGVIVVRDGISIAAFVYGTPPADGPTADTDADVDPATDPTSAPRLTPGEVYLRGVRSATAKFRQEGTNRG